MCRFSLTNDQKNDLKKKTLFLDSHYDRISNRQRQWHVDHQKFNLVMCKFCNSNHVKWDFNEKQYRTYCSTKCAKNSPEVKEKTKATCLEKYGYVSNLADPNQREKIKQTMLEKYGVEHQLQHSDVQAKSKATKLERYGDENFTNRAQAEQTYIERYGVKSPLDSPEIRDKIKQTIIERYGVDNISKSPEIQEMKRNTLWKSHGIQNHSQLHFNDKTKETLFDSKAFRRLLTNYSLIEAANELGVDRMTIHRYAEKYDSFDLIRNDSYLEKDMLIFLNSIGVSNIVRNTRKVIHPYEVDFFLPDFNIAIEMNGNYWHSTLIRKNSSYHFLKWNIANKNNIRLLQFLEADWHNSRRKIQKFVESCLGMKEKGSPGRKCSIRQIDAPQARLFLEKYHLQGFVGGTHFGAFDETDQLVGAMTFGWTRGNKNSRRFELKRWVTDDKSHAGLFSKTFRFAQKEMQFNQVVSFSMNDWFTGDVYEKAGFVKQEICRPGYGYVYDMKKLHASNFTKGKIKKKFPDVYSDALTETEMTHKLGLLKIYDSGKTSWLWKSS